MGQPIKLVKGDEETTVYGQAQLAVMKAEGWQVEGEQTAVTPTPKTSYKFTHPDFADQEVFTIEDADALTKDGWKLIEQPEAAGSKPAKPAKQPKK